MKKLCMRLTGLALALLFAINCSGYALATSSDMLRASPTLNSYSAILKAGTTSGTVRISYDVIANKTASSVGISSIVIYKSNGDYVDTITGTERNGLIATKSVSHSSSYSYSGTSGTSYYAEVTVFATIDGVTDSRTVTTNTVKAP